jgi:Flp pilus assembly protein CpaB
VTTELERSIDTQYLPASPVRRSVLSRIRLGHVVMITAAILALVFNLAVLRGRDATVEVVVARADIPAGTTLTVSHFSTATVPADDVLTSRFLAAEQTESIVGELTTRAIAQGDPILASDLLVVENQQGLRAMSVPIDQTQAVGGQLAPGDSVDVILVQDGIATYIATGVEVLDVPNSDTNALGARTGYAPTLAVDATQALRIASALDLGPVHIVRSTGSALPDLEQATAIEEVGAPGEGGSG